MGLNFKTLLLQKAQITSDKNNSLYWLQVQIIKCSRINIINIFY